MSAQTALMNTYGERSTTLVSGQGTRLRDLAGRDYLDTFSGIAVCGLGHSHPAITTAITEQASTLLHTSNLFNTLPAQQLAQRLCELSGMKRVFFSNSGTEANEAAIKLARKYAFDRGIHSPAIITTEGSFHGRTLASLSATGNPKVKQGFSPLVEGFIHVPFNNIEAIISAAEQHDNIIAILVEPIQGEGGIRVPDAAYLPRLHELCQQRQWLLMLDEIQTGNGRTGEYFAYQHYDLLPDVVTTAKGLGNGIPIGACLARGAAGEVFQVGNHGSTFGGNPFACRVAQVVIDTLVNDQLIQQATALGDYLLAGFRQRLKECPTVVDIRGKGLMLGIELSRPCSELVEQAKQQQLLINVTAGNTIRLLPPLIITREEADSILTTLSALIQHF